MSGNPIYHIAPREAWGRAQAEGAYRGDTLATEGFIHASTAAQVVQVANRFYRGRTDVVLLCIDAGMVRAEIRYEGGEDGERFPHIYGALNLDAVSRVLEFRPMSDGTFEMPPGAG